MRIAVIGAGYVGLVTAVCLAARGHKISLVEVNHHRLKIISSGKAPFFEPGLDELLQSALDEQRLMLLDSVSQAVQNSDATFIAVGTPPLNEKIDLSQVKNAAEQIGTALRGRSDYHVVVVKSTVVPGTTDTLVREAVEAASGLQLGQFGLCMNPEFLREGSAVEDFQNPDRIVIGQSDHQAGELVAQMYDGFDCPFVFTNLRNAELTKYASNALLAVLISFSNEFASICESIDGLDIDVVLDGLHLDRRLSPMLNGQRISPQILTYLRAGCGFGGSCLPKDVNALRQFAQAAEIQTPLLDACMVVNESRPQHIVRLAESYLAELDKKTIAVLGLAFKPKTDDVRESPALKIIDLLEECGAQVRAFDPLVTAEHLQRNGLTISASVQECIEGADAAIIATGWPEFNELNWSALSKRMSRPIIIDGRRSLSKQAPPPPAVYHPIGTRDRGEFAGD